MKLNLLKIDNGNNLISDFTKNLLYFVYLELFILCLFLIRFGRSYEYWQCICVGTTKELFLSLEVWESCVGCTLSKILSGSFPFHLSWTLAIFPSSICIWTLDFINT